MRPVMNDAYLLLGSNIDAERNLPAAVAMLSKFGHIAGVSRVWQSAPVDGSAQPDFLNAAVLLRTPLPAAELRLSVIDSIETSLKRERDPNDKNAARTIDIDIVLFNREVAWVEHRRIPDPEIVSRVFALQPLVDIAPDYVHPDTGVSLKRMLEDAAGVQELRERGDVALTSGRGTTADAQAES
ncbi:MAG: 2-amino-4-hydroxy-6-hydroxymethyldihydropteridine diphosphokinase [Planctomycetota bacterium]|mgnify:CR=1 FL=1|nr:MAG: 2-amino-4-hydroxy-6-hydroxymethyldihydropteridine diphosphokinase [Planctomycetota bacterium]REJ91257.1 MAG: 2-amino-4-hydroxy-6-hydroxymethyldihydropteridine diphosphokinase [Planctomycetota bacterium]REK28877.1 MAG: 2-amino-4-hydroxy-6-hydroxymethyldihydropteridine diphosphokinase [Planctomycetota bacterium]REK39689.1 MAG: 2-amino-4-hydroxy-6-hydroxymethyldihydropteridine diphosphokinase [Planctomycetota bacterium]